MVAGMTASHAPTAQLRTQLRAVRDQISTVIRGKPAQIADALTCLLAGGHLLIEDVPGVGKTTLAQALAITLGLRFQRSQFTADLLPSDLIGTTVYEREQQGFVFHPGPCSPRCCWPTRSTAPGPRPRARCWRRWRSTRSASMASRTGCPSPSSSSPRKTPASSFGTFPLPESQLDRFLMRISLGYPDARAERELLLGTDSREQLATLPPMMQPPICKPRRPPYAASTPRRP